ncbi:MAG: hypothetical protein ABWZ25_18000 [Chitinophagaceae bacterium]
MELDDRLWATLDGAFRLPFNASRPLRKLQDADTAEETSEIFTVLWENLYNQGDVGLASYLSVPQLIRIAIEKKSFDQNFIGLILVIENSRINGRNPELPVEFDSLYFGALTRFEQYLLSGFKKITDRTALLFTLALFATLNGQPELGAAIEKFDK